MGNKLISTNGWWFKIKKFFINIFSKNKSNKTYRIESIEITKMNQKMKDENNLIDNLEEENRKQVLVQKLLYGEMGVSELNDTEVDEMTNYFSNDIKNIDDELARIGKHIVNMQQLIKQE